MEQEQIPQGNTIETEVKNRSILSFIPRRESDNLQVRTANQGIDITTPEKRSDFIGRLTESGKGEDQTMARYLESKVFPMLAQKYDLSGYLGKGLLGIVFDGRAKSGESVVIKVANPGNSPEMLRDFEQEITVLGTLVHGQRDIEKGQVNTPIVQDSSEDGDEIKWFTQTKANGEKITEYLDRGGSLTLLETLDTLDQTLRVLQVLHQNKKYGSDLQLQDLFIEKTPTQTHNTALTIIDWNVVGDVTGKPAIDERQHFTEVSQDIAKMAVYAGKMYSRERIADQNSPATPSQLATSLNWVNLPEGLKLVFERALSPDETYRYKSVIEFRRTIGEYRTIIAQPLDTIRMGLRDIYNKISIAKETGNFTAEENYYHRLSLQRAVFTDILRYLPAESRERTQANFVLTDLAEHGVRDKQDFWSYKAKQELQQGNYETARTFALNSQGRSDTAAAHRLLTIVAAVQEHPLLQTHITTILETLEIFDSNPDKAMDRLKQGGITNDMLAANGLACLTQEVEIIVQLQNSIPSDLAALTQFCSRLRSLPTGEALFREYRLEGALAKSAETHKEAQTGIIVQKTADQLLSSANRSNLTAIISTLVTSPKFEDTLQPLIGNWVGAQTAEMRGLTNNVVDLRRVIVSVVDNLSLQTSGELSDKTIATALTRKAKETSRESVLTDIFDKGPNMVNAMKNEINIRRIGNVIKPAIMYLRANQPETTREMLLEIGKTFPQNKFLEIAQSVVEYVDGYKQSRTSPPVGADEVINVLKRLGSGNVFEAKIAIEELFGLHPKEAKTVFGEQGPLYIVTAWTNERFQALQ